MTASQATTPSATSGSPSPARTAKPAGQRCGDEWARKGDPQFRRCGREVAAEGRDTAEQPQRDAVDLHPLPARLKRVPQLVQEERAEEDDRGRERHPDVGAVGEPRVLLGEDRRRERPGDEREDDQPAPMDADADAGDAPECQAGIHGVSTGSTISTSLRVVARTSRAAR